MRILVTGNMGYVGPAVVERLRAARPLATLAGFDAGFFAHCLTGVSTGPERRLDVQRFGDGRDLPDALFARAAAGVPLAAPSNAPIGNRYQGRAHAIHHPPSVGARR